LLQGQFDPASTAVLIVESDPHDLELACRAILSIGIPTCFTVPTGEAALAWLENNTCDVVVFEHKLAGMNGQQFMTMVKQTHPDIRLIATSQNRDPRFGISWVQNGAADFVAKDDFYSSQLGRSIQAAARSLSQQRDTQVQEELTAGPTSLETANSEANWLLRLFRTRYGYNVPLPVDRENELQQWPEVVQAFYEYLETSLHMFPDTLPRAEDAVVRMVVERGLSPRDMVLLYQLSLMRLKDASRREQQRFIRVNPSIFLARVLIRVIEEYQRAVSFGAAQNLA
jgi:DNA-binding response OmpR family regulator